MKQLKLFIVFVMTIATLQPLCSQSAPKPVYVIVHGAWGGGWAFKNVASELDKAGNTVYRPTLTGQGERVHLASQNVGLDTHILDVVNTILYEELTDIILVGHSYGGMVVTGVANAIPERIQKLIYLDAFVPEDMESANTITGGSFENFEIVDNYIVPPWVPEGQNPPKDVPHPFKTWKDPISLKNPDRLKIPTHYILTVAKGTNPKKDDFASQAERASIKGWPIYYLESDHNPQWSALEAFVQLLKKIENIN